MAARSSRVTYVLVSVLYSRRLAYFLITTASFLSTAVSCFLSMALDHENDSLLQRSIAERGGTYQITGCQPGSLRCEQMPPAAIVLRTLDAFESHDRLGASAKRKLFLPQRLSHW